MYVAAFAAFFHFSLIAFPTLILHELLQTHSEERVYAHSSNFKIFVAFQGIKRDVLSCPRWKQTEIRFLVQTFVLYILYEVRFAKTNGSLWV